MAASVPEGTEPSVYRRHHAVQTVTMRLIVYIGEEYMDVLADGAWENVFNEKPEVFTEKKRRAWLDQTDRM